jgi:HAD superfamily hydrolase (TIGR01509 family)
MIKLIIFDLDGVLIDSKKIHFETLNKALTDYNIEPITYEEHIAKYDGLPTKKKLILKGIEQELHESINNKKQEYTFKIFETTINENKELISLFETLKKEGYIINVASNSIRYTVLLSLFKLGILKYVSYVCSNEDVEKGKPYPEMYLKCMLQSKVGPRETLIIEDSYVGREGTFNSGAYLCPVNNCLEVCYKLIKTIINKANNVRNKWKGNNMNILIPMAGAGSRFLQAGYTFPKPLIEVNGKSMIQLVVENINIEGQYIFIVRKEHYDKYNLKYMLDIIAPKCKIICVDELTEGAACTTLLAKEYINNNEQLLIANSDQWIKWDSSDFMYSMQKDYIDGGILTFENTHPKWSYVKINNEGFVTEVKEKMVDRKSVV